MSEYVLYNGELYHYGVKGMRWGHRKKYYNDDGSLNKAGKARQTYKDAKKDFKTANKEYRKASRRAIGITRLQKAKAAEDKAKAAYTKSVKAEADFRKAKAKDGVKAQKAEYKTYKKAMLRTGLPGSAADDNNKGLGTKLYKELSTRKGKEYADKVAKGAQNQAIASIAAGAAVGIGMAFINSYVLNK